MNSNVQAEKQPAAWHTRQYLESCVDSPKLNLRGHLLHKNCDTAHTLTGQETCTHLGADATTGLSDAEAARRLACFGPNTLSAEKKEPFWEEFIEELREPMVLMLLVTGVLYAIWGELGDGGFLCLADRARAVGFQYALGTPADLAARLGQ